MHALLDVITPACDAIQHRSLTALLLMDLRKAFDTVSHQILLQKLLHYEIRVPAYCFVESCLSNSQQFVSINNSGSPLKSISIYVNDLTNVTFCHPRLFAEDTCLAHEVNCNSELLHNWCNGATINWCNSATITQLDIVQHDYTTGAMQMNYKLIQRSLQLIFFLLN